MKIKKFSLFLIAISCILIGMNMGFGANSVSVSTTVNYANYGDFDGDGYEDDVYINVTIDLSGGNVYNFDYYLTLTLPSGLSYTYGYSFVTDYDRLVIHHYLMGHATEPGWYDVDIDIIMKTGGIYHTAAYYIFDPPGGQAGAGATG